MLVCEDPSCETEFCEALHYSGFLRGEQTCSVTTSILLQKYGLACRKPINRYNFAA